MNLIVIGAGAWGTALAIGAARHTAGHQVTLWARNAQQVQEMQAARSNPRYLPDMAFPDGLQVSAAPLAQAVQGMDLVRGTVVAHSLGNFVFDMDFMRRTMQGIVLEATFWGAELKAVDLVPYRMDARFVPHVVRGRQARQVLSGVWSSSTGPFARD